MAIEAGDELCDFPHGGEVGGNVEGIGDQQQQYDALKTAGGNVALMLAASPFPVTRPMLAHMY
jgi:hypothetical protein